MYNKEKLSGQEIKRGTPINKEDLLYLFMELNLTRGEVAKILGTTAGKVSTSLKFYGISKTRDMLKQSQVNYFLRTYGVTNPRQIKTVVEKAKKTCLERYGHECSLHGKGIKEKVQQTFLEKYGDTTAARSKVVREKTAKTNLDRYGYTSVYQSPEIREKIKRTNLERYGVETPSKTEEVKEKIKKTNLVKYGVEYSSQATEVREKVRKTHLSKTRKEIEEINKKREDTCLQKYGVSNSARSNEVKERTRKNNLEKYGVEYPISLDVIKEKRRQNNFKKWGTTNISTSHLSKETLDIISSKEKLFKYINKTGVRTVKELANLLNISYAGIQNKLHNYNLWGLLDHFTSSYELELQELFPTFSKTRKVLYPYEIDLYNEELKLGIEFNGTYWHSTLYKEKEYHQKKSLLAEERGIFLYHIFEEEWNTKKDIVISQINSFLNPPITGDIIQANKKDIDLFLEQNSLEGIIPYDKSISIYNEGIRGVITLLDHNSFYEISITIKDTLVDFSNIFPLDKPSIYIQDISKVPSSFLSSLGFIPKDLLPPTLCYGDPDIYDCGYRLWVMP